MTPTNLPIAILTFDYINVTPGYKNIERETNFNDIFFKCTNEKDIEDNRENLYSRQNHIAICCGIRI